MGMYTEQRHAWASAYVSGRAAGTKPIIPIASGRETIALNLLSLCVIVVVPSIPGIVAAKLLATVFAALLVTTSRPLWNWPTKSLYYTLAAVGLLTFVLISFFSLEASGTDQAVESQTTNMFATLSFALLCILASRVMNGYHHVEQFFRLFAWVCAVPCASACLTVLLAVFGLEGIANYGEIFHSIPNHLRWTWYFPLTLTSGKVTWLGHSLPRLIGICREPGIFQCYLVMCLGVIDLIQIRFKSYLKVLYCVGLLLTFSTIGLPLCMFIYAYIALIKRKLPVLLRVLLCLAMLATIVPILSLGPLATKEKLETLARRDRNNSRTVPILRSIQAFRERPWFGYGIFSSDALSVRSEGISLLASIHKFGLVGLVLMFTTVIVGIKQFYTRRSFAAIAPLLITALTAQPIFMSGMLFFMLGIDTRQMALTRK
jgi:hypothetical protein